MLKTLSYSIVAMDIYISDPMVLSLPACLYVRGPLFHYYFPFIRSAVNVWVPIILGYYLWFCIKYISDILYSVHKICCMTISFVPKLILEYLIVQIM